MDADRDGWDDRWVARYPDIDRSDPLLDSNGDGVPNLFEMAVGNDPYILRPKPVIRAETVAEELLKEQARERGRARMRAVLAPYINYGLRDAAGNPTTRKERKAEALRKLEKLTERLRIEDMARQVRVAAYLAGPGKDLPPALKRSVRDVTDAGPAFVTGFGHRQATQLGVRYVWPGGYTGFDLTGSETAVAMWDLGMVDHDHEQFAGGTSSVVAPDFPNSTARVFNYDTGFGISEHATAVATVICGAGDPTAMSPGSSSYAVPDTPRNNARGMIYAGGVRVYDRDEDLTEMGGMAAMTLGGSLDIVFSCHAYGTPCGWQLPYQAPQNTMWTWYGDPAVKEPGASDSEWDYKFGFYSPEAREIDNIVHTAGIYLPVWAAGNDGDNISASEAPENQDSGPATHTHTHIVALTGDIYDTDPGTPHPYPPRRLQDWALPNVIPEACAKNVLTVTTDFVSSPGSDGPTDDWRMKPELKADGGYGAPDHYCALDGIPVDGYRNFRGSSFSAAGVTGGLALIRQRWVDLNGSDSDVLASTWKALVLSSSRSGDPIPPFFGEDGYFGSFDATTAIEQVERDAQVTEFGTHSRIKEIYLEDGASIEFDIERTGDYGTGSATVTICWTDPPGTVPPKPDDPTVPAEPTEPRLVNDIDLRVTNGSTPLLPYRVKDEWGRVEAGDNTCDNVEHVYIPGSVGEQYTVEITHKGGLDQGLPQPVSVVLFNAVSVAPEFRILDFSETAAGEHTLTWASTVGGVYRVEESVDLVTWTPLPGEIAANNTMTPYPIDTSTAGPHHFYRIRQVF